MRTYKIVNSREVTGLKTLLAEKQGAEVEETVITLIRRRRELGRTKYDTTMERDDLTSHQWLTHLQEELLDAAIYAEKLKREI